MKITTRELGLGVSCCTLLATHSKLRLTSLRASGVTSLKSL